MKNLRYLVDPKVRIKKIRVRQKEFLKSCLDTQAPLSEILGGLDIDIETFAKWLCDRVFRNKLHEIVLCMRKTCNLTLEIASVRAATTLAQATTGTRKADGTSGNNVFNEEPTPLARAACVDVIRLARDSRARRAAQHPPVGVQYKRRLEEVCHPDVPEDVAEALIKEMTRPNAAATDVSDAISEDEQ